MAGVGIGRAKNASSNVGTVADKVRARKVDANQAAVIDALRKAGAAVTDTSGIGGGYPDLTVSYRNQWFLLEVKDGRKPPSARMRTDAQIKWSAKQRANVWVVKSIAEALAAIGAQKIPTIKESLPVSYREVMGDDA
jgi:hypothetical protein